MVLKLPRLRTESQIIEDGGKPSREYTRRWDEHCTLLEDAINGIISTSSQTVSLSAAIDDLFGHLDEMRLAGPVESTQISDDILLRVPPIEDAAGLASEIIVDVVSAEGRLDAGETLPPITSTATITFAAALAGATGYARTAAGIGGATISFVKYPGASTLATAVFASGSNTPTFTAASAFTLGPGEAIYPVAPATQTTLADIGISWKGTK